MSELQSVKIGPIRYQIEYVKDLCGEDGEKLHGLYDDENYIIRLNINQPNQYLTTLWHEIIHAFEGLYALELGEKEVTILGTVITQILQDNPGLRGNE